MRTTLTLDDDIAKKLKELAHRRGASIKEIVNQTLRRGLRGQETGGSARKPFRVKPFRSEFRAGVDRAKLNQLSDELEARQAFEPHPPTGAAE